jgi:tetratricopeptide (TPR) repeat protein
MIPRFDGGPESVATVELGRAGDKQLLLSRLVINAIVRQVVDLSPAAHSPASTHRNNDALARVADKYQLEASDVEAAIQTWKVQRVTTPDERPLKALYENRDTEALKLLRASTKIKRGQFASESYLLGVACFRTRRFQEGAGAFDEAVRLDPQNTEYLIASAKNFISLQDGVHADEMLDRAVSSLDDEWHNAVDLLVDYAAFLEESHMDSEAEKVYARAYTLGKDNYETPLYFPRFDPAIRALAAFEERRGDYERAAQLYRESFIGIESGAEGYDATDNVVNITRVWRKENKRYSDQDVMNYLKSDDTGDFSEGLRSQIIEILQKDRETFKPHEP